MQQNVKPYLQGGNQFLYKGKMYPMIVKLAHAGPRMVFTDNGVIYYTSRCDRAGQIEGLLALYKVMTRKYIDEKLPKFAALIGVTYNRVTVKNQKTRLGSCSSKNNLNFNLRLAMMPDEVADYILIHELCHLKELNHSKAFWTLVGTFCPDYAQHRAWLKHHVRILI